MSAQQWLGGFMKKNANKDLRKMATQAKKRLKKGFYHQKQQELQQAIECVKTTGGMTSEEVSLNKRLDTKREIELARSKRLEAEEQFYKKVCKLLQNDSEIIDPIGKLVDKEIFDNLQTPTARQKYILDLSAKFREMSERYNKERLYTNF